MQPLERRNDPKSWTPERGSERASREWTGESWTGEPDSVAAIALVACLALAAFLFLILAAMELG